MLIESIKSNSELSKNIRIFGIYRFLSRFYMYLPILAVVLYSYKLSYLEMSFVIAMHGLAIMVVKVPLGYISKKINSQKRTVLLGEIVKTLGILGIALSNGNLAILLVAQAISGAGFALTSSVESALLFSSMKYHNEEANYRKIEARTQGYSFISILISGVIGSVVASVNMSLSLFLSAPFSLISGLCILFFDENNTEASLSKEKSTEGNNSDKADRRAKTGHLLLYYAFNRAVILTIFVFILPLFLLNQFKVDLALMGTILGLFSFSAYFTASKFEKVSKLIGKSRLWLVPPSALTLAIVLLIVKNTVLLVLIPILFGIAAAIVRPLSMGKVNELIKENRSRVMSIGEQLFGILNALFLVIMGALLYYYDLFRSLYVLLSMAVIGNIVVFAYFKLIYKTTEVEKKLDNPVEKEVEVPVK